MKLTKLQNLVEAVPTGIDAEIAKLHRLFDNMEGSILSVQKWADGQLLSNALKHHGHPETESKAFRDAVNKMYGEFEDLKMALILPLENAKKTKTLDIDAQSRTIEKAMRGMESELPRECRYKSFNVDQYKKEIHWITQESSDAQGEEAAKTIARVLRKLPGIKGMGWTVKVTVRDYGGGGPGTKWQGTSKV